MISLGQLKEIKDLREVSHRHYPGFAESKEVGAGPLPGHDTLWFAGQ